MKLTSASHPRPCALRVGCLDCRILSKVGTVGPKGEIKPSFRISVSHFHLWSPLQNLVHVSPL